MDSPVAGIYVSLGNLISRAPPVAQYRQKGPEMKKVIMKTLGELVEEFGANGVIRIDAGNGCAGPAWIEWDDGIDEEMGDIEMFPVNGSDRAYEGDDEYANKDTIEDVAKYVIRDYSTEEMYASEWVDDGDGYWFRVIF